MNIFCVQRVVYPPYGIFIVFFILVSAKPMSFCVYKDAFVISCCVDEGLLDVGIVDVGIFDRQRWAFFA